MSEHNITVEGGTSIRLPTAGKYCDRDIIITAGGGGGGSGGGGTVDGLQYITVTFSEPTYNSYTICR